MGKVFFRHFRRSIVRSLAQMINAVGAPVERYYLNRLPPFDPNQKIIIFIVGSPRSGSTLLTQLITSTFHVGYITNLMEYLYRTPYLAGCIGHPVINMDSSSRFESDWGKARGLGAPNEASDFWNRWFSGPNHDILGSNPAAEIRNQVGAIMSLFDGPLVVKNPYHVTRIQALASLFPLARFIAIRRDLAAAAESILKGRLDQFGSLDHWVSFKPPGIEDYYERPCWEQAVEQVALTNEAIDRAVGQVGSQRFFFTTYERICQNPQMELALIRSFLEENGTRIEFKRSPPNHFTIRRTFVSKDIRYHIEDYIRRRHHSRAQATTHRRTK